MTDPSIRTERLLLRKFREADIHDVFLGLSDPEVIRYYGVSYGSPDDTREQMQWFEELEETGKGMWWAICTEDDSRFYGGVGLNNLSTTHRKAEIGFWLLPRYWGKGLAQEAAAAVLSRAFKELKLHRVEAQVETGNTNSAKLLHRLGFKKEGTMVDCEVKNGEFISIELYAKLEKE